MTPHSSWTSQQVLEKMILPKSINISIQLTTAQNLEGLRVPLVVRKNIHLLHNRPRLLIKSHEELQCKTKCTSLVCILLLCFSFTFFTTICNKTKPRLHHERFSNDPFLFTSLTIGIKLFLWPSRFSLHHVQIRNQITDQRSIYTLQNEQQSCLWSNWNYKGPAYTSTG